MATTAPTYTTRDQLLALRAEGRRLFLDVCFTCGGSGRQVHVEYHTDDQGRRTTEIDHDLSYDEICDDCDGTRGRCPRP